jgi:hypothetical protein
MVPSEWDMGTCFGVSVLLGETEINDVDLVVMKTCANQKIGRLDVAVNEMGRVDTF